MPHTPHAVALTPADACAAELLEVVEHSLSELEPDAVLQVSCDPFSRLELAEWCLTAGHRIANPFDHWEVPHLLIERGSVRD